MKIGVISVNNNFFTDVISEVYKKHSVQLYEESPDATLNAFNLGKLCNWADLIWAEFAQPPFQFALNLAPEKKIIVRIHRIEIYNDYIYSLNWNAVDMLIFSAQHVKDIFYQRLAKAKAPEGGLNIDNKPRHDMVLPTNVVDHKTFRFLQRDFKQPYQLCLIGHLIEIKRCYDLIQWFKDVDARFRLNIVASDTDWDASYGATVKRLAEKDSRIEILSGMDKKALSEFMRSQDIIISHSREEGTAVNVIEAMATGCYPLLAGWNGAGEVYSDKHVYNSPKEFYKKLEEWADLDELQKLKASIDAYEFTKPYNEQDMTKKIVELIENVYNSDKIVDYYDSLVNHMIAQKDNPRNQDALKFLRQWITPEMKVLDLGCGIGVTTECIHQKGANVVGLDLSAKAIEYARKHSKANYRCGSIFFERFYYKFDCVVMADVLEHVKLEQHPQLFELLAKITNDQGMLIINLPHPAYMKELRKKYPFGNLKIFQPVDEVVEIEPLLIQLKEAGFSDVKYSKSVLDNQYYKIVVEKGEVEGREKRKT